MPFLSCRRVGASTVLALVVVGLLAWAAPTAGAHPLGNFTTNRYALLEAGGSALRVHYVLDEAELVAFQERTAIAGDRMAFADARAAEIAEGLRLRIDGDVVAPVVREQRLTEPPGEGGLTTLRLEILFEAPLPPTRQGGAVAVQFEDRNQPERIGWREIVVRAAADGSRVLASDAPAQDRTSELRRYPEDPVAPRLDVRRASFTYLPGTGSDRDVEASGARIDGVTDRSGAAPDRLVGLIAGTSSSPLAVASALLAALALGGVHALGPGHGKTVMAAYLVSTRGRRRDAVYLGGIVSLMHTASVLGLAILLATVGRNLDAARVYPGLTVVAGVLVTGVGIRLITRRWRTQRRVKNGPHHHHHDDAHAHEDADSPHPHGVHGHDVHGHPDHGHHDGPGGHSHALPPEVAPLSRAGLVALGTSGGLFPSPSAVLVLVGAFALGRAPFGMALTAAFSVGLALVLVAVGLLLVAGRDRIVGSSLALRLTWLPLMGAVAVTLLGLVLVGQGYVSLR